MRNKYPKKEGESNLAYKARIGSMLKNAIRSKETPPRVVYWTGARGKGRGRK